MSVVASSRPDTAAVPYGSMPQDSHIPHYHPTSPYVAPAHSVSSRFSSTSSINSINTTFSVSSAPASFSPVSPTPPFLPYSAASRLPHTAESPFRRLPPNVYASILNHLEYLHMGPRQTGCITCFQRDLHSLSLTCRSWEKAVRAKLYNRIHILGNDSPYQLKKYRLKRGSRLKLLRRTLRERKLLANLVLELRVPQVDMLVGKGTQWQEYRDLVASVVMVCPNLERLLGLSIPYNHEFDRLTYALSTRKKLKEHTWILGEPSEISEGSPRSSSCPGSLGPLEMFEFLNYHVAWTNLQTLMLYAINERSALEPSVFLRMFNLLPSLRNLCISSFNADAFGDSTLVCLPPLESLRLEHLPGVTDSGLSQYSSCSEAHSLTSLTLIELSIDSLLVISKMLASLPQLERFTIVQSNKSPTLPDGELVFQPLLASSSLKHLHWDISSPRSTIALSKFDPTSLLKSPRHSDSPNSHLAQSILAGGFPCIETLRAPSDIEPLGALQNVCQPIPKGQAILPSDRYSLPRSSHGSVSTRGSALPAGNNLTSARIRAQTLIEMAAKDTEAGVEVVITDYSDSYVPDISPDDASSIDEDESEADIDELGGVASQPQPEAGDPRPGGVEGPVILHEFRLPAFMGRAGVKDVQNLPIPRFILRPEIPGADVDGGLVRWRHLLSSNQSLTYAAGIGANCFANRSTSSLSPIEEPPPSPASSRFGWGSIGSRSTVASSPVTSTSPSTPISMPSPIVPPWERDTCTGSWNSRHKNGRDWWYHIERDRPGSVEIIDLQQFF